MNSETPDRLVLIFECQRQLMTQFNAIEATHGLLTTPQIPVDLQSFEGQTRIRDFAWRFTEELGEAICSPPGKEPEELADALHFLVELAILANFGDRVFVEAARKGSYIDQLDLIIRHGSAGYLDVVIELTTTINLLKNRPWKQTSRVTDVPAFHRGLMEVFLAFGSICRARGLTASKLYSLYRDKHAVNQKRIDDGQ